MEAPRSSHSCSLSNDRPKWESPEEHSRSARFRSLFSFFNSSRQEKDKVKCSKHLNVKKVETNTTPQLEIKRVSFKSPPMETYQTVVENEFPQIITALSSAFAFSEEKIAYTITKKNLDLKKFQYYSGDFIITNEAMNSIIIPLLKNLEIKQLNFISFKIEKGAFSPLFKILSKTKVEEITLPNGRKLDNHEQTKLSIANGKFYQANGRNLIVLL